MPKNCNKKFSSYVNGIVCVKKTLHHYNVALCFLLEIGSFTNVVICIYVLKIETTELSHTLKIDCFMTVLFSPKG